jgi:hypothetical protein
MFFGTLDTCAGVFLQQTLEVAAYEASRLAVQPGTTTAEVVARCEHWIKSKGIATAEVVTTPDEIAAVASGQMITITVTAPYADTALFFGPFYDGRRAEVSFHCLRRISDQ